MRYYLNISLNSLSGHFLAYSLAGGLGAENSFILETEFWQCSVCSGSRSDYNNKLEIIPTFASDWCLKVCIAVALWEDWCTATSPLWVLIYSLRIHLEFFVIFVIARSRNLHRSSHHIHVYALTSNISLWVLMHLCVCAALILWYKAESALIFCGC